MPIYVENNSPLLSKMRQMILVNDIADIQLIKNRLWNGVHAMTAWYASLLDHPTIGLAMADGRVREFCDALLMEVQLGLKGQVPQYKKDLERLSKAFLSSCHTAFKDPCQRVARDPLRKLSADERVLGSLQNNIQVGLPYKALQQGIVMGCVYAVLRTGLKLDEVLEFIKQQLRMLDITTELQESILESTVREVEYLTTQVQDLESSMDSWMN